MNNREISIKALLDANTVLCGASAFLACTDIVSSISGVLFVCMLCAAVLLIAFSWPAPPRFLINVASLGILFFSVMRMRLDTVVSTSTEAVLLMIAMKMLEGSRPRDYLQILSMAVLAVISASVLSVGGSFIYYCVLISILGGAELVLITWFSREPQMRLSYREAGQVLGRSLVIWGMMLPLCLLLFFAAPRARTVINQFQRPGEEPPYVGFSENVTLGSVRSIQTSDALAFRAEMPPVAPRNLYWRGLVLDTFRDNTWTASRGRLARGAVRVTGDMVTQEVFMEPGNHRSTFALDMPVQIDGEGIRPIGEGIFVNMNPAGPRRLSYTAYSMLSLVLEPPARRVNRELYLQLPPDYMPALRAVVADLASGRDATEVPDAILAWLAPPNFNYTLEDLPVSGGALEAFLFSHRKGNCEFFAAAMAVMLRMAGVPSRLVAGYYGGVYNETGGYYIVAQKNAHVWVEAWNDAEGHWRRYDPTPAVSSLGAGGAAEETYGTLLMYLDILNYRISRLFLEYDRGSQVELVGRIKDFLANPLETFTKMAEGIFANPKRHFLPLTLLIAVSASGLLTVFLWRRRKRIPERILLDAFLAAMHRCGYAKYPQEGLREFLLRAGAEGANRDLIDSAWAFLRAFEPLYYKDASFGKEERAHMEVILGRMKKCGK